MDLMMKAGTTGGRVRGRYGETYNAIELKKRKERLKWQGWHLPPFLPDITQLLLPSWPFAS